MFDSRLRKPTPKNTSDYTFVNIISRDECKHMHKTCSRLEVQAESPNPLIEDARHISCQATLWHNTLLTLTKFQAAVCQAWLHILHEDLRKQWVSGGNLLKETMKYHVIAELNCPTKTVTNRCHVNFHIWYGSLSNVVELHTGCLLIWLKIHEKCVFKETMTTQLNLRRYN
jgi:hypothetical protein